MEHGTGDRRSPFLDLVRFPAARWELLMAAEEYGADLRTRTALLTLTAASYADARAVRRELDGRMRRPRTTLARPTGTSVQPGPARAAEPA